MDWATTKRVDAPDNQGHLERSLGIEQLIAAIARLFTREVPRNFGAAGEQALAMLGEFMGADRAAVVCLSEQGAAQPHAEWRTAGCPPGIPALGPLNINSFPWLLRRLHEQGLFYVPSVEQLPAEAGAERALLESLADRSALAVPIYGGERLRALLSLGFLRERPEIAEPDLTLLRVVGDLWSDALRAVDDHRSLLVGAARLERVNRALRTISAVQTVVVTAQNEAQLLRDVCSAVCQNGGFRGAWIGLLPAEGGRLRPAACCCGYSGADDECAGVDLEGASAAARAIRERQLVTEHGMAEESGEPPVLHIALPLLLGSELLGVVVVLQHGTADLALEEAGILEDLARNFAYGITALRARVERRRAQDALEASELSLRTLVERDADGVLVLDREGSVLFVNPAAERLMGRSAGELLGAAFGFPRVTGEQVEIRILRPDRRQRIAEMRVEECEWVSDPGLRRGDA